MPELDAYYSHFLHWKILDNNNGEVSSGECGCDMGILVVLGEEAVKNMIIKTQTYNTCEHDYKTVKGGIHNKYWKCKKCGRWVFASPQEIKSGKYKYSHIYKSFIGIIPKWKEVI